MREETMGLVAGAIAGTLIVAAARAHSRRRRAERIAVPAGVYGRPWNTPPGRVDLDVLADAAGTALLAVDTADRIIRTYRILKRLFRY